MMTGPTVQTQATPSSAVEKEPTNRPQKANRYLAAGQACNEVFLWGGSRKIRWRARLENCHFPASKERSREAGPINTGATASRLKTTYTQDDP